MQFSSFVTLAVNRADHWQDSDRDGNVGSKIVSDRFYRRIHRWAKRWCYFWCGHSWMWPVLWMFLWAKSPSVPNANETFRSQSMALSIDVLWCIPSLRRRVSQYDHRSTWIYQNQQSAAFSMPMHGLYKNRRHLLQTQTKFSCAIAFHRSVNCTQRRRERNRRKKKLLTIAKKNNSFLKFITMDSKLMNNNEDNDQLH